MSRRHPKKRARSSRKRQTAATPPVLLPPDTPPIVAIGASAGGLAAFEQLFSSMPSDSGIAFVLIQHLNPDQESLLPELLQRHIEMPVQSIKHDMPILANQLYIIPPNRELYLNHNRLQLQEPSQPRGLRLPIDHFFRSLAEQRGARSIGIILSGTGSDGTLGIRAIKTAGGLTLVQQPESAQYDGMPNSAIATGAVDHILPAEKMAELLSRHTASLRADDFSTTLEQQILDSLDHITALLQARCGHDFSHYKPKTLIHRIERRLANHHLQRVDNYLQLLQQQPQELTQLFQELLIGVTSFFRDKEPFQRLQEEIIPSLFNRSDDSNCVRIWVPGCSTGEEAYSLALLCYHHLQQQSQDSLQSVQIFATDIDEEALKRARNALYPESIRTEVPEELLSRYFEFSQGHYRVIKPIRQLIIFANHSVIKDPPFSQLDLISCRNLFIYLQPVLQKRVLSVFHYALQPHGYLLLGNSEGIGSNQSFTTLDHNLRLYQRNRELQSTHNFRWNTPSLAPRPLPQTPIEKVATLQEEMEEILINRVAPTCLIINEQFELLYSHGNSARYLRPADGPANLNLLKMVSPSLKLPLTAALHQATSHLGQSHQQQCWIEQDADKQLINLTVGRLEEPTDKPPRYWVALQRIHIDGPPPAPLQNDTSIDPAHYQQMRQELDKNRRYLQATVAQMEGANEALTSSNEELLTSNEELQSTTEELRTSQEELRSVNEELLTVNNELEAKMAQLNRVNNDLTNLIATTPVGILFVDQNLGIQRFTPAATQILHLLTSDIGRPLQQIATRLEYDNLVQDAKQVIDTLQPLHIEVRDHDHHWYALHMQPYRTENQVIEGVVLSFINIDAQRQGQQLRKMALSIEHSPAITYITDRNGRIEYINRKFTEVTGYTLKESTGRTPRMLKSGEHDLDFYRQLWDTITSGQEWHGELHNRKKSGETYWVTAGISPVLDDTGRISHFVAIQEDISAKKLLEQELLSTQQLLHTLLGQLPEALLVTDSTGLLLYVSPNIDTLLGYTSHEVMAMEAIRHLLGETFSHPTPEQLGGNQNLSCQAIHKAGHEIQLQIEIRPIQLERPALLYRCQAIPKTI